jgi:NADH:ubiquinone reductase (H+-translocating)
LPEMKPSLANFAHELLEKRGVEIHVNTRLTAVTEQAAVVKSKVDGKVSTIPTRTVVATVPVEPHPIVANVSLKKEGGRILVNEFLHCDGTPNVWAVGDCATIPLSGGGFAPPTAQHAVREGKRCAQNIIAAMRGEAPKKFTFETLGSLASLGRRSAVADVMGVRLSGLVAWILWRVIYLSKFPGWDRRLRILSDWTWDIFLPRDITQVRIFRHAQVHREHFEPGEDIIRQGDIGDRVYFVVDGEAELLVDGQIIGTIGAGGVFGEIALMNNSPRTATIRARTSINLASVQRDAFHTLVAHFPGVKATMDELLAMRTGARKIVPAPMAPPTVPLKT